MLMRNSGRLPGGLWIVPPEAKKQKERSTAPGAQKGDAPHRPPWPSSSVVPPSDGGALLHHRPPSGPQHPGPHPPPPPHRRPQERRLRGGGGGDDRGRPQMGAVDETGQRLRPQRTHATPFDCFCCPRTSVLRPSTTGLAAPPSRGIPPPPHTFVAWVFLYAFREYSPNRFFTKRICSSAVSSWNRRGRSGSSSSCCCSRRSNFFLIQSFLPHARAPLPMRSTMLGLSFRHVPLSFFLAPGVAAWRPFFLMLPCGAAATQGMGTWGDSDGGGGARSTARGHTPRRGRPEAWARRRGGWQGS